jgi:hypothetical protein
MDCHTGGDWSQQESRGGDAKGYRIGFVIVGDQ